MCRWMAVQEQKGMIKNQKLLRKQERQVVVRRHDFPYPERTLYVKEEADLTWCKYIDPVEE